MAGTLRTVLLALALFATFSFAAMICDLGAYGGDCSCSSDVPTMLSDSSAVCAQGQWTLTPNGTAYTVASVTLDLVTDKLFVAGNLVIAATSTVKMTVNSADITKSSLINVQKNLDWQGFAYTTISDWNRTASPVDIVVAVALFQTQSSNAPTFYQPDLYPIDNTCWRFNADKPASFKTAIRNITLLVTLENIPGAICGQGRDRSWVVVFIVIIILWGVILGVLAIVTCKLKWCYTKFWELK